MKRIQPEGMRGSTYSHLIGLRLEEHVVLVEHVLVGSCWGIRSIGNQID